MTKEFIQLRNEINKIDNQLMILIKKRLKIVDRIKKFKIDKNLPFEDRRREEEIIRTKAEKSGLPKKFVSSIYKIIFSESKKDSKFRE